MICAKRKENHFGPISAQSQRRRAKRFEKHLQRHQQRAGSDVGSDAAKLQLQKPKAALRSSSDNIVGFEASSFAATHFLCPGAHY